MRTDCTIRYNDLLIFLFFCFWKSSMSLQGFRRLVMRSHGLVIRSLKLDNSFSRIAIRSLELDNSFFRISIRSLELDNSFSRIAIRSLELDKSFSRITIRSLELDNSFSRITIRSLELDNTFSRVASRSLELHISIREDGLFNSREFCNLRLRTIVSYVFFFYSCDGLQESVRGWRRGLS